MSATTEISLNSNTASTSQEANSWSPSFSGAIAKKGIWALGDQFVVSGMNFISTVIVGRWCGFGELGLYSLVFILLLLISVFQHSLILNPYTVFSCQLSGKRKKRYSGCILAQQFLFMAVSAIGLLVLAILTSYLSVNSKMVQVFFALSFTVPLFSAREFIRRFLLAQLNTSATFLLDVCVALLQISGLLILAITDQLTTVSACLVIALSCGLPSILWFAFNSTSFDFQRRFFRVLIRKHWNYGRWICASQFTDVTQSYAVHWILAVMIGVAATGYYSAYYSIIMIFNPFILAISSILLPRASQVYHDGGVLELRRIVLKGTIVLGMIVVALSFPVVILSDRIVQFLYEVDIASGNNGLMIILALTVLLGALSFASDCGLNVLGKPEINFLSGFMGLIVTAIAAPIFALFWNIEGAALGVLIAVAVASSIQIIGFIYVTNCSHSDPVLNKSISG
ncbi:MAG: hypothetical protein COA78_13485 [Blastopirellula sp.]|nr:MAG: hypothetical protein COA78_13485 [Blastopirellula sp.]